MKNRPARVRELIQRELGAIIMREMNFSGVLVTIQAVDLTADFKHCHVHVGVLGTEREQRDVIHALAERRPQLQHELSRHVILKYTPRLHFHLDHSVERGTKVMEIMRQIDEITPPEETVPQDARAKLSLDTMQAEDAREEDAEAMTEEVEADEDELEIREEKNVREAKSAKPRSTRNDEEDENDG